MKTSLQIINGKPYYFEKNGRGTARKWIKHADGNKRYSLGNGKLATGHVKIGNRTYYFDSRGLYTPNYLVTAEPDSDVDVITHAGKTYKMYCQYEKNYTSYNKYLASHGCTLTTLTCVLGTYVPKCKTWTPYETLTIAEKKAVGTKAFKKNYKKKLEKQIPISFYCVSKILKTYGIDHQYKKTFTSDAAVKKDIRQHLKNGMPIIFVISRYNRATKRWSDEWTGSYHTMLMIGIDENDNVLIGNPAGSQRFQLVPLDEMVNYMWSCTKSPNNLYWNGKNRCGGYIKITE